MKIAMEAERANAMHPTGVEHYAIELIRHLAQIDHKNEYTLYFRTEPQPWFHQLPANFKIRIIPFPKFWTQTRLAWEVFWNRPDVFFLPIQALPFIHPKNSVITVHDVAYEIYPNAFAPFMRFYLKLTTRWGVWRAKKIITVSESTKNDVARIYGTKPEKINTIHLGLDDGYVPMSYENTQAVLDKYNLVHKKYILFVGTLQPRKNIVKLIEAYLKLRKQHHLEEKLVIVGGKGWLWEPIMEKIDQSKYDGVVYLDYIDYDDLKPIYSGATCLTLPALYEGFGIPPLEAMACGTPIVVSNLSSLPEVAGGAGILVDPDNVDSIADGLLKVVVDKELQAEMSKKGIERAKMFTWRACAEMTLKVFESFKK